MFDVMDIMLKIGITEEVTSAFHSISNIIDRVQCGEHLRRVCPSAARCASAPTPRAALPAGTFDSVRR
jgi:hypothetical protein